MNDTKKTTPAAETPDEACSATEALRRAKAELDKAQAFYEEIRQRATDRLKSVREASVGDMLDNTLDAVRRHPGAGLTVAAIIGFLLGRLLRR